MSDKTGKRVEDFGKGVGVGALVTLGVVGAIKLVSSLTGSSQEQKPVQEEAWPTTVKEEKVRIRVRPQMPYLVYDKDRRVLAEAEGDLDVGKRSIDRIRYWSVRGSGTATFYYQKRNGDWEQLSSATSPSPTPVRLPYAIYGGQFVEVHSFPPDGYHPTEAPSSDPNTCTVCMAHTSDVQVLPCAHLALCWDCLQRLQRPCCPVCRRDVLALSYAYKV